MRFTYGMGLGLWAVLTTLAVAQPTTVGNTTITAQTLSFDYKRFIAVFENNVVVVDPDVRMEADRLNVVFEGSNSLKSVSASGNVHLWHQDKEATCQRAVYVSRSGEVVLRGDAVLSRGDDRVMGDEITFWLHEDRMTCTPGRLIIGPQSQGSGAVRQRRPDGAKPAGSAPASGGGGGSSAPTLAPSALEEPH